MLRLAGIVFLGLAAVALIADVLNAGGGFGFASIGERWAELHRPSLIGLQSGLENRVSGSIFFDYVLPILQLPAAIAAAVLGLALYAIGRAVRRRGVR